MLTPAQADIVVEEAKSWLNTPYVPRALIKGVGVDCGGLLYKVYERVIEGLPRFPDDYSADWALHSEHELYLDWIAPFVDPLPFPVRGGLSVFHFGKHYAHGAIYIGNDQYIHAWGRQREGRVTQNRLRAMMNIGAGKQQPLHFEPK